MGKNNYLSQFSSYNKLIPQEKINKILVDKEMQKLKEAIILLSDKYNLTPKDLTSIVDENIEIPSSIYQEKKISTLEITVKYLKEELHLRYSQISKILNRDERTVWTTYNNTLKKTKSRLIIEKSILIPIKVLSTRKYSILESITEYLKETQGLRFSQISRILSLDQRTIWTCYHRIQKKRGYENEAR